MKPAYSDRYLLAETKKLKEEYNLTVFFETGTHIGISTSILSALFDRVYSVEIKQDFYEKAIANNADNSNVVIEKMNSVDFVAKHLREEQEGVGFFLDAHWGDYWPLLDELRTIAAKNVKPVIFIHDFYVPGPNGKAKFHFDKYKGKALNLNFVKKEIEGIYGVDNYRFYCIEDSEVNSGVGVFAPLKE
jgi:predicted O-methyltransferase YrrM